MKESINQEQEVEKSGELADETSNSGNLESAESAKNEDSIAEEAVKQDPLKKLQDDLAEAKDKFVRLYAEFENHRRRTSKEKLEMIQSANEELIKTLLPVADDFERAEKSFKDKNDKESEGFFLIQNKFKKILEQYGVTPMEFSKKSDFNPDFHEAITQTPVTDEKLKGKVVDVIEKGYLLNDKVIRFAKVIVGS
ncbi:MAG: nucleotide exchange factor GrpE [Bacteroidia bacterium]|nr:nucleotide exchange factor GrpE [Bacteroidia bacterium]